MDLSASQLVTVEFMYDSSRKMVSSTWFSAESNLQWRRTIVRIVTETDPGNLEKREPSWFVLLLVDMKS